MSETLFKFLLSELQIVRVRCRKCGGVAELPVGELSQVKACPVCRTDLTDGGAGNVGAFGGLSEAIKTSLARTGIAEIEFVLPVKEAKV